MRHFRPTLCDRWSQRLEITSDELLPDQLVPLLKRRWELNRKKRGSSATKSAGRDDSQPLSCI
ncbi:protein of unknown function [Cyanobium sp. NIES-981]|nr:protein of unknown function [Cyanobium sp. NIES-981]